MKANIFKLIEEYTSSRFSPFEMWCIIAFVAFSSAILDTTTTVFVVALYFVTLVVFSIIVTFVSIYLNLWAKSKLETLED